ncbi:DUF1878 domain-containing protein [Bacillus sp. FJAT-29814]|uniref:DUF1878 domain-containing protein n=1 Tax=Bacillus sp. FJAT-29814 TaxID=1729688 RepID=UPI000B010E3A|nr:DUF1878 domain-containing protein [Bacillus sp. FJAT-29814]
MTLEERLDFIEFRQQLLFDNDAVSRMLFEYNVTRQQYRAIIDIFNEYRNKIEVGEDVNHNLYEQRIYEVVPQHDGNYHFAEAVAQTFHEDDRWTEVFEALYGDMQKFQSYMQNRE